MKKKNLNNLHDIGIIPIDPNDSIGTITQGQGIWSQIIQNNANIYDPWKTVSISADEKEYLETIEIAADLLASEVITPQEYFKLKMLLKSKDSEVKNTAYIFLNLKGKL